MINKASTFGPLASPPYPGGDVIVHVSVHFIVFFERAARAQRTELIIRSYFRVEKRVKTDRDSYYEHIFKFARPYVLIMSIPRFRAWTRMPVLIR